MRTARRRAAGEVRARDVERVGARVGRPHLDVGQLGLERERDRARTGAEVGDASRRLGSTSERCRRRTRRSPRRSASSSATSTTCSVSGRGIEHAPVDHEVEPAERPRAEHVLQRLARDAAVDERPSTRVYARAGGGSSAIVEPFGGAVARHVLDEEPTLRSRRSRCPRRRADRRRARARSRQVRASRLTAVTRRRAGALRSSAASASTISSSSPSSTRSSACTVSPMR